MSKAKVTPRDLEERYQKEDRGVAQERSDFLLPQIIDFVNQKKWMNLQPEYQRRQVWDRKKKSQFIESLLMNLPVPPVFLFEPEYSRYEVMDGQQRLSAIVAFYTNRFKLSGLEYWPELNGFQYDDLPPLIQRGLDRRRLSAVVLQSNALKEDYDDLRKIVFERLNTGGQKLNAQELRNCIYSSSFAKLLVELAGYDSFNDLLGMPRYDDNIIRGQISSDLAENPFFKRMIDCELVLRFFAFRKKANIKGSVKSVLDKCMVANLETDGDELDEQAADFRTRIDMAKELFGDDAFKIRESKKDQEKVSPPYYDAIIIACDRQFSNRAALIKKRVALKKALDAAIAKEDVYELIVGRANTADAIKQRLDLVEKIFIGVM
ncbi:DUF262 domain-containing protein [Pseudomonas chlororaphis]|uniref:DUF262 domain-containing protein n=2 Tax=Pseudomonas chlororaphis TaxID=587753 RepID=UPI00131F688C|nr:DUF262 domain-containing protein [Pseudomonas chlororaphis]QHC88718.1 hypothetical protein PchlR47_10445 [Pseudomonas chlororaphis]